MIWKNLLIALIPLKKEFISIIYDFNIMDSDIIYIFKR
jgi:hypothetical protein